MLEQYTPTIESAQAYLTNLQAKTIARQEQEIERLHRDLEKAQATIGTLAARVRDLELDMAMCEPRQPPRITALKGLSKTEQVKRLAVERGVSVSTMWRRVQSGEEVLEV